MSEQVFVPSGISRASGGEDRVYHTDESCRYITDGHQRVDLKVAEARGARLCALCDPTTEVVHATPDRRQSLESMLSQGVVDHE